MITKQKADETESSGANRALKSRLHRRVAVNQKGVAAP